ncbi:MAG TPA: hypothetical protein VG013_33745 [Gemmataceae bacterium]|nr:hypothetical protein [Gemmataceae bacterium]
MFFAPFGVVGRPRRFCVAWVVADGEQVSRYWGKYRQVLVTNYRDFVLVGQDPEGRPVKLETYRVAANESAFWAAVAAELPALATVRTALQEALSLTFEGEKGEHFFRRICNDP